MHDEHCGHDTTAEAGNGHDHGHGHGHDHKKKEEVDHGHGHGHGHEHKEEKKGKLPPKKKKKIHNLSLVSSVGFTIEGLLDTTKFNDFMSTLLQVSSCSFEKKS